jgi:DNA uptake protein ComE-like DNA-binding protein
VWTAITLAGWVISTQHSNSFGGLLIILGWAGGAATSFSIRGAYERKLGSPLLDAEAQAQARLEDRQRARELARRNPELALEVGVGRPDRPGAVDGGLIDVNNAGPSALATLPGITDELVARIVEARAQTGGFTSVEDLGIALDIDGATVEALRDRVVFLPRSH